MSAATHDVAGRRWAGLAVIAAAQFMVIMDTSIIGVALPRMQSDLGFDQGNLSWVFNAYVIALGGLLLLGGRLSDLFGARRIFSAGWVVLIIGSVLAGAASSVPVELLGRAVQGAGSALIAPSALTLLMTLFGSRPSELPKAFALYGAAAPAGGTAGVFLGGVITEYASWPWVFYVNIPVALVILGLTPRLMPAGALANGSRRVDVLGAGLATAGLATAVFAIVEAPEVGWGAARTWALLVVAAALLSGFVAVQRRRREPLVRLEILRTPNLAGANIAQFLLGGAWIPMWFFLNLYLQQVLGFSAFPSGSALLPMTALIMIGMVVLAPRLMGRLGPKRTAVTGLLLLAAGMAWLAAVRPDGSYAVDVLPASLVAALGMSLAFIPTLGLAISSARPEEGGLASGLVNTSYQLGSALGLAVMTAIAAAATAGATPGADGVPAPEALTDGFSAAFVGAAVVAVLGGLAVARLIRTAPIGGAAAESQAAEAASSH
ncbi:MFS transporter [Intrasporangium sp.]|uniref:MFS transporter n=1 Tax=Intrasporangium sp. TaxID=1925024 RepID=UPI00293B158F|nr:MFS transporter [Intrasporangium sp.]MDV3221942.1 MFS transporter [Intrasporangium sp.]